MKDKPILLITYRFLFDDLPFGSNHIQSLKSLSMSNKQSAAYWLQIKLINEDR